MKKTCFLSLVLAMTAIVGFACGGGDAAPTTRPTSTSPAVVDPTATSPAVVEPTATSQAVVEPTATSPAPSDGGSIVLEIGSVNSDILEFDTSTLTASAGAEVTLTFSNNAVSQQHNWVLVKDGTKDAVAMAGVTAPTTNWVSPDDANVITNAPLIAPGESANITFTVPSAGKYQFVCTFPGHNLTMFGTFEVTS